MKEVKNVDYGLEKIFEGAQDFLPLLGTDYVEFYVGNAKQAAHFYKTAFGFQSYAYAGLETGLKDRVSYVLKQDKIRLVLTTALNSNSEIGEHVKKHGDGVKIVALWVEDARKSYEETIKRGAKSYMEPFVEKDEDGNLILYVAIADVGRFIDRGSNLDNEAFERGTSVYFSQKVIPMLPEVLSNDLCSLKPNEDRFCLVCKTIVDKEGNLTDASFFEAIINSKSRLTYGTVTKEVEKNQFKKQDNLELEYAEITSLKNLLPISKWEAENENAICIAAYIDSVRLIDNIIL